MSNIIKFFQEIRRKRLMKKWRALAIAYKEMGESSHWIRARITEYIGSDNADDVIILEPNQTKEDYIEDILSVLHESKTVSGES
jgi:hypothetical protein